MRRLFIFLFGMSLSLVVNAGKVTKDVALQKAQQFMPGKSFSLADSRSLARGDARHDDESFYILNADGGKGFVIVSGDDRVGPILGYSDSGRIDMNNMSDNLRALLGSYEQQIKSLPSDYQPSLTSAPKAAIEPLIKTLWGQDGVYNAMCPLDNGVKCKVGCTATALAQVMNYHKWPEHTHAIPGYVTYTKQITVSDLPATDFKWDLMKESYAYDETGPSADAVAELMRYCSQGMHMDYEKDGSGTSVIIDNLVEYFGYSRDAHYISRSKYTYSEWENIIYNELKENRPVLLAAFNNHLAHEFICDGYDGKGLYHMNWGWYGDDNGFYLLSVTSDGDTSISSDAKDIPPYCYLGDAIIGIQPTADEATYNDGTFSYYYNKKSKEASITGGNKEMAEVIIPESVSVDGVNYRVTAIAPKAFYEHYSMTSLTIPSSVKVIGVSAFERCTNLGELNISEGVEVIEDDAFSSSCHNVAQIILPSTIVRIGGNAFYLGYTNLKRVISYSDNPCVISQNVFCSSDKWEGASWSSFKESVTPLTAILYVPVGTKSKYESAGWAKQFYRIDEGEPFNHNDGVLNYSCSPGSRTAVVIKGDYTALNELDIPAEISVESVLYRVIGIDDEAFQGCMSLTSVTLHDGIQQIGKYAFAYSSSLTSVSIPEGLESIGNNAFFGCDLGGLYLPSTLKNIGWAIVSSNDNISSIVSNIRTPQNVILYNEKIFMNQSFIDGQWVDLPSPATLYIPKGTLKTYKRTAGWNTFQHIVENENNDGIGDLNSDGQVNSTDLDLLVNAVTEGNSPSGADVNGDNLVNGTDIVSLVNIMGNGDSEENEESVLSTNLKPATLTIADFDIKAGETKQMFICLNNQEMNISMVDFCLRLPSGLSVVQEDVSMAGRTTQQKHTINTKTIGDVTHVLLYSGENATISGKNGALLIVPLKADDSYQGGTILLENQLLVDPYETETKPDTYKCVISSGNSELNDGDIFTIITPDGIEMTFQVISAADKTCQLGTGENTTSSFDRSFSGELTIPSTAKDYSVVKIAPLACSYSGATQIKVSQGIKIIEDRAFAYNTKMTSLSLPEGLTEIGNSIVWGCEQLKSFHVPSTVARFETDFGWCDALEEITVASGNTSFDSRANCNAIIKTATNELIAGCKTTNIPSTVKKIGNNSFSYLSLTEMNIPEGVERIESASFSRSSLKTITIPSTVNFIGQGAFRCDELNEVTIKCKVPFALMDDVFLETAYNGVLYVPSGTKSLYAQTSGWNKFVNIVEKSMHETISIGSNGKISYTAPKALDFSGFDDLKAYVATGFDASGTIWLTRVKQVPAGTPLLIKGIANESYDVPFMDKCMAYFENMFVGNLGEEKKIGVTSEDGKWVNYYLGGGAFKKATESTTVKTGKCYLQLPASFNAAKAGEDQKVTISKNGKSSYAPPVDVDLTDVEGLKAYAATGYDAATSTIWLTRIFKIQAGEGVLLKGEAETEYTLPSAAVQAYYGNMFVGNTGEKITINETSDDGVWTNFYLASGSFKKVSDTREIGTNKSYLHLPTSLLVSSARGKKNAGIGEWLMEELETETMLLGSIGGEDEDGTTRIDAIRNDAQPDVYYNLQGQRVNNPKKGLYIRRSTSGRLQGKNGKIVVIR